MSDTHAHTAKVQADVQTGHPHNPPGHVESDRPVERLDDGQMKSLAPWLTVAAVVLVVAVLLLLFAT